MFAMHLDRNANSSQAPHLMSFDVRRLHCLHLAADAVILLTSLLMSADTTTRVESSKNMVSLAIIQRDFEGLMVLRMYKHSKRRELLD